MERGGLGRTTVGGEEVDENMHVQTETETERNRQTQTICALGRTSGIKDKVVLTISFDSILLHLIPVEQRRCVMMELGPGRFLATASSLRLLAQALPRRTHNPCDPDHNRHKRRPIHGAFASR